ncbi:MAG: ferrochelatase [Actinomycetes bacterium]
MSTTIGVLVMAYGTPGSRDEIEPYYTRIRHGRPPTTEQLDDLVRRYEAIGGISPLAERTAAQVAGLAARLEQLAPGRFDVRFGSKYTEPSIEATAAAFRADGINDVVGIVLTPHQASMGSVEYMTRAATALTDEVSFHPILEWYDVEGFAELQGRRVVDALHRLPEAEVADALLLVTAHSLPARIIEAGDPYPDQLADSARQIADAAGIEHFEVGWQSAGRTPEPWLGPDILEHIAGLPARGIRAVVVCPVGFVADHLEVLYDVDIDAARVAAEAGVLLERTASLNDDPTFIDVLARAVLGAVPQ